MDIRDQIKSRLPIEQLVGQYCQLKKKGRNYVCLCPFHSDKNPSFLVSPDKGIGYCFACQSGGDIFSFYQKIEGVDFPTAVRQLSEKAGVELPKEHVHFSPSVSKDEKTRIRECLEAAAAYFRSSLAANPDALAYVRSRGVDDVLLAKFGLGYAPESFSATYEHLLRCGFSRTEVVAAGLGVQKDLQDQRLYDRFRHRIMFPITDPQGGVIGFGGRTMGVDDAKYINSPDGPLYHKSSVLFGFSLAKEAMRAARTVVLVEGYFDVVACHKAGVHNVVAVSGTALTEDHVRMLRRSVDTVILCLDQDAAGQMAAERAFGLLADGGLDVRSVTIPAKDPDEMVQRDPAAFVSMITQGSVGYLDATIDRIVARTDLHDLAARRRAMESFFALVRHVHGSVELRGYLDRIAQRCGALPMDVQRDFSSWMRSSKEPHPVAAPSSPSANAEYDAAHLCLGLACTYPVVRPYLQELIPLADRADEALRKALLAASARSVVVDVIDAAVQDADRSASFRVLALFAEEHFPDWSDAHAIREFRRMVSHANRDLMVRRQMEIVDQLRQARREGRVDEESRLLHQYQQVLKLSKMSEGVRE